MFKGISNTEWGGGERDAAARSLDAVEDEIAALASHIHAATYRLLQLIYELDARQGWSGFRSCAHWLNWRIGLDLGAAREKVRVARALPALPSISSAFRRGTLSYSKVRAVTRVATPENEAALVVQALEAAADALRQEQRQGVSAEVPRRGATRCGGRFHGLRHAARRCVGASGAGGVGCRRGGQRWGRSEPGGDPRGRGGAGAS